MEKEAVAYAIMLVVLLFVVSVEHGMKRLVLDRCSMQRYPT